MHFLERAFFVGCVFAGSGRLLTYFRIFKGTAHLDPLSSVGFDLFDLTSLFQCLVQIGADFWEVDLETNFSIFRVRRFTEWPGPLHWTAFPVEILTKPLIHWIPPPFSLKTPFFFSEKCFVGSPAQKSALMPVGVLNRQFRPAKCRVRGLLLHEKNLKKEQTDHGKALRTVLQIV